MVSWIVGEYENAKLLTLDLENFTLGFHTP